jgi:hypothetical protein
MVAFARLDGSKGVLVTRHSHRDYAFTLSHHVPYGQTEERHALISSPDKAPSRPFPKYEPSCGNAAYRAHAAELEK